MGTWVRASMRTWMRTIWHTLSHYRVQELGSPNLATLKMPLDNALIYSNVWETITSFILYQKLVAVD